MEVFNFAMQMRQWVQFVLSSSHHIFYSALKNKYWILCAYVFILAVVIQHANCVSFFAPYYIVMLRWSRGSVLAFGTQVPGSNPAEAVGFFGRKNPQCAFLRRGSKAVSPMSVKLRHVKEPKSDVEVATFGKFLCRFSPILPPSATGVRSRRFRRWRCLVPRVGTF